MTCAPLAHFKVIVRINEDRFLEGCFADFSPPLVLTIYTLAVVVAGWGCS
jgi:hypothetical protein